MYNISNEDEVPELLESDLPEAGPSRALDRPKIPLTLLTGYLGAGKSTLLEYILTADHGYRIAVCMNDFGDSTDIEARTLTLSDPTTQSQSTSFLSLPNGCLCCSVKDLGIAAIEDMVASTPEGVDWVIVELTGIADPAPIAKSFWANEEMGDLVLDGVVCVVDSRNVLKQLGEERGPEDVNECQKQVACADVILLNKIDLISSDALKEVEQTVREINPTLRVHHTIQSRIPLEALHDLRAFSSDNTALPRVKQDLTQGDEHEGHDGHGHSHAILSDPKKGNLNHQITSILISLPTLSNPQFTKLTSFLESLLWESLILLPLDPASMQTSKPSKPAPEILRTKGYIITVEGEYILQGVSDLFELKDIPAEGGSDKEAIGASEGKGKIVFIGRGIDDSIRDALLSYVGI